MKALAAPHTSTPRVITVDKNAAYPKAFKELKAEGILPDPCELRQSEYLNNLVEQEHRFIKRLVRLGMGFFSSETAWQTLQGYVAMNMRRSGQIYGVDKLHKAQKIAFAVFEPGCFDRPRYRNAVDGLQVWRIIFFKDQASCFESGHFCLNVVSDPAGLGMGPACGALRFEQKKLSVSAAAVEKTSRRFALRGKFQLFSVEVPGSFQGSRR